MVKRVFDIVVSVLALVVSLPFFLIIALLIKVTMPGPVFFVQERVGRSGRIFPMFKFRSMSVVAGSEKGSFDAGSSRRITPLGRILRKTKLDELPQFFNVLAGHMSIVGPRPEVRSYTELYPERWQQVHQVRPGITDNASITFRNEEQLLAEAADPIACYKEEILPRKLDLYIEYIRRQSFLLDLQIIFKTFYTVLFK